MSREFDPEFVRRAQAGDTRARDRILVRLEPILRAYFIKRIGMKAVVDDLVQNTLLRIHKGLPELKQADRLKAFALKAALFEVQDYYRGRYTAKEDMREPTLLPDREMEGAPVGLSIDLERALAALTPKARRILELREYGYRYEEIAQMLDTTEAAVKMQVKRAFARLREILAQGIIWMGLMMLLYPSG